jgi:hypothetical protein
LIDFHTYISLAVPFCIKFTAQILCQPNSG